MSASGTRWERFGVKMGVLGAILLALVALIPVTVWRCGAHEDGRGAQCRIESTLALAVVRSSVTIERIAATRVGADYLGIRLLDADGRVVYVRDQPPLVGTWMTTLASGIDGLARGAKEPIVAWQWPRAVFVLAVVVTLLLALLIKVSVRAHEAAATMHARRPVQFGQIHGGFAFFMLMVGVVLLVIAPATVYSCRKDGATTACTIERRVGGLVPIRRHELPDVASASASTRTVRHTSRENGRNTTTKEERGSIRILSSTDTTLYDEEYFGAAGAKVEAIAERINIMAQASAARPFTFWHVPFVASIFATVTLLFGVTGVTVAAVRLGGGEGSRAGAVAITTTALLAVAGWMLALLGRFPT